MRFRLAVVLLLPACFLDRSGLAPVEPLLYTAAPDIICIGDLVTLRWQDQNVPRDRAFCETPDSNYGEMLSCEALSDCPSGAVGCSDGVCVHPDDDPQEVDYGAGCPVDARISIEGLEPDMSSPFPAFEGTDRLTGSISTRPANTIDYTLYYETIEEGRADVGTRTITVVQLDQIVPQRYGFGAPECVAALEPRSIVLGERGVPQPSSTLSVVGVINSGTTPITLSAGAPDSGPALINPGERSDLFNGDAPARLTAQLIAGTPGVPMLPLDCTVDEALLPPPMEVQLLLACGN